MRFPTANKAYHPEGYDRWWAEGRKSALNGKPRVSPYVFNYGYESACWFDGYDNIDQSALSVKEKTA